MAKKREAQEGPKLNPYKEFTSWLFDGNRDNELNPKIIPAINPKTILERFGDVGAVTIFLNDYFNRYDLFSINKVSFFNMLKDIVIRKNINQRQMTWWTTSKKDEVLETINVKFPTLKRYEIETLLQYISDDDRDKIFETCGLNDYKEEKIKVEKVKRNKVK